MAEILIVQDEPIFNEWICESLSRLGYKVYSVSNAEDAMSFLKDHSPAVVISEEMKILKMFGERAMPFAFVMLSKPDESRKVAEAMKLGALDFSVKNDQVTLIEKSFVWMEIGNSLRKYSTDAGKQKRLIELFRTKCSAFQESV